MITSEEIKQLGDEVESLFRKLEEIKKGLKDFISIISGTGYTVKSIADRSNDSIREKGVVWAK